MISPPVALAPMVGLSHSALRSLVQEQGGVGVFYTEMLSAKRLPHDNQLISPLLIKSAVEQPLIYQLIASDDRFIEKAVGKIHCLEGDGIDLNLGCPAPLQKKKGAGASLTEKPELLVSVLSTLRKCTDLPLSVKIRLGRSADKNQLREFCDLLVSEGVDMITIHARLHGEKFCRKPRWAAVGEVRESIRVPLFVNGGIFSVEDARKCLDETGADGLMIGRGALQRPWLCAEIADEIYGISRNGEVVKKDLVYHRFIELLEDRFPVERQLGRLKRYTHYYATLFQFGHHLASAVQSSGDMVEAKERAGLFFQKMQ